MSDYFDEDVADYKTQANNTSKDDEERVVPLSGEQSYQERLSEQLHLLTLNDKQFMIADILIGNLDESGYLSREITAIVDDLAFSLNIDAEVRKKRDLDNKGTMQFQMFTELNTPALADAGADRFEVQKTVENLVKNKMKALVARSIAQLERTVSKERPEHQMRHSYKKR